MKKEIPAKVVQICDVCHRENNYLLVCNFCKKEHCLLCESRITGCVHQVGVCKECESNPIVIGIVEKHAPIILGVIKKREDEIKKAGKAKKK